MTWNNSVAYIKTQIYQGNDLLLSMQYKNSDGTPRSLSGVGIEMDFRAEGSVDKLAELSLSSGITVTDEPNGVFYIDAGKTANWPLGLIESDIKYTVSGKTVNTNKLKFELGGVVTE